MAAIWDEDPKTWETNYWKSRKNLGMTKDTIVRDVGVLKNWLKNHEYLPPLCGGKKYKYERACTEFLGRPTSLTCERSHFLSPSPSSSSYRNSPSENRDFEKKKKFDPKFPSAEILGYDCLFKKSPV